MENIEQKETDKNVDEIIDGPRPSDADTYTTKQIAKLLQIGITSAGKVMREIKSVSDTLGIAGIVHVQDYNYWLSARLGKGTEYQKAQAAIHKKQRAQRKVTSV